MAGDGRDGDGVAQAQVIKLVHIGVLSTDLIGLVYCQYHRLAGTEKHVGYLLVGGSHARLHVADKDNDGGGGDGDLSLLPHEGENLVVSARLNAAGVYNIKGAVSPLALGIQPVTGDTGGVLHDGQALAAQLIEQHGLAHVGTAHNSN